MKTILCSDHTGTNLPDPYMTLNWTWPWQKEISTNCIQLHIIHISDLKLLKYSYDGVLAGNCQYWQQWASRWNFLETGDEPTTRNNVILLNSGSQFPIIDEFIFDEFHFSISVLSRWMFCAVPCVFSIDGLIYIYGMMLCDLSERCET